MSKTDKDKPYWVRLNEDAEETWHRHDRFGEKVYRTRAVRDAKGNLVYDEEPIFYTAREVLSGKTYWGTTIHGITDEMREQARESVWRGGGPIQVGVRRYIKRERVYVYTMKDYCTEGEPVPGGSRGGWDCDLPCTPHFTWKRGYKHHTRDMSDKKTSYRNMRNGKNRVEKRALLGKMTKVWNAGAEVDDFDEEILLTAQHRHSMAWDLY